MIFSCSSDIWTTILWVFNAVSIAAFAEFIIDSCNFSWRDSEIVFCFCKSSCSTSCTTFCSEFSSITPSKFSKSDKPSRFSRLSVSKSSKLSVSSSFKDASSSIGKLIEVSSPIFGNKSCKESKPSSSSSKPTVSSNPTGSSETSSFFCKSSRLVT